MEKKNTKNPLRFAVLLIFFIALPFARHRVRNHAIDYINQQLPHQVTQQELDYIQQLSEKTGEKISVYLFQEYDNINGTPNFDKVIFLIGEENAFTGIGCALFEKKEINKQVGFMNVVSGYDTVLDKVVLAHTIHSNEAGFEVYDFDYISYKNRTFYEPAFVVTDRTDVKIELCTGGNEIKTCEESDFGGVYEISQEDRYNLETIYFYDNENNLLGQYRRGESESVPEAK